MIAAWAINVRDSEIGSILYGANPESVGYENIPQLWPTEEEAEAFAALRRTEYPESTYTPIPLTWEDVQ